MNAPRPLPRPGRARLSALAVIVVAVTIAAGGGCGPSSSPLPEGATPPPPQRGAAAAFSAALASASASSTALLFNEADFTASERNRDPFRSFTELFTNSSKEKHTIQSKVIADRFALDELKLVAIVTGSTNARAMFIDPEGKGWIVTLGQLIGRSENVRAGGTGGAEYELNWRVDRIREGDVVFVRETPGISRVPTATRVIALRPAGDDTSSKH